MLGGGHGGCQGRWRGNAVCVYIVKTHEYNDTYGHIHGCIQDFSVGKGLLKCMAQFILLGSLEHKNYATI